MDLKVRHLVFWRDFVVEELVEFFFVVVYLRQLLCHVLAQLAVPWAWSVDVYIVKLAPDSLLLLRRGGDRWGFVRIWIHKLPHQFSWAPRACLFLHLFAALGLAQCLFL